MRDGQKNIAHCFVNYMMLQNIYIYRIYIYTQNIYIYMYSTGYLRVYVFFSTFDINIEHLTGNSWQIIMPWPLVRWFILVHPRWSKKFGKLVSPKNYRWAMGLQLWPEITVISTIRKNPFIECIIP